MSTTRFLGGPGQRPGNLVASYHANTPLIITSGQQHRELVIGEPYLGNREATTMPKPWVKWSYEPARAEDVPEAFMRAYAMARQPPTGPVYLSVHMDDWKQPLAGPARLRTVSDRVAPRRGAPAGLCRAHLCQSSPRPCLRTGGGPQRRVGRGRRPGGEAARRRLRVTAAGPGLLPRGPPVVPRAAGDVREDDQRPAGRARPGRGDRRRGVPLLPLRSRRLPPSRHGAAADHRQPRGRRGRRAVDVETGEELEQEFKTALGADTTTVIVVRTQPQKAML